MAGPKRYIKNVNLTKPKIGVDRRIEIFDNINKNQGFLPRGIGYEDMDSEFIKFVENDLEIIIDGQKVPVIMLSIQRWAEFSKTWEKSDEFKDIKIPFITIVRNPAPEPGTNQAGLWNIAGERVWEYRRVPSFDGVRQGVDVYKIPQPTSVDLTYNVRLFANKMRDVNKMNHIIHKLFVKRQFYIYPNEHPMPVILEGNSDESEIGDFENRRYYVQNYELKLQGYTLDEDDFKKIPAINRNLIVSEVTDDDTPLDAKLKEVKFPKAKNKVGVYNSDNKLLSSVFCGENYIVGDSNVSNSGGTYNVNLPATNNLLLPNVELTITNDSGTTLFNNLYPSVEDINVTFTCPESDVYINGSLIGVTSGGDDFNIDVQQNGSAIGFLSGNTWIIPDNCADANWVLKDTSGNTLNSGSIASGDSDDIIAPDSTYLVQYSGGTLIQSGSTPSGGFETIVVANCQPCEPVTSTFNNTTLVSTPCGENKDIILMDEDDNEIGTIDNDTANLLILRANNADVEINGVKVGEVLSEGLIDVPVIQDGSPVGSWDGSTWNVPSCPAQPEKVYARPWQTQVTDVGTANFPKAGDEYYQRNDLGLWHQRPGRVMVIDETNHLMLKDLSAQGIDNTNPLGDYRRYTATYDQDFDFSNNTPNSNVNQTGYYTLVCDWLTGTMWCLVVADGAVTNKYMYEYMNTPYNGPIPHDGSPSGTYTPNWFFNTVNNCLNTTNKLIYGFDDWQVPSHAHHSSIYNHDNGGQLNAIFGGRTALLSLINHDSTYRGSAHKRWRMDGVGSITSVTDTSARQTYLLCREIDENDFPLNA